MSAGELLRQANQLKRSGKLDEAIALYHQVIDINPHFAWAYHGLGDALAKQGSLDLAVTQYQKAIKINPNSAWFNYKLAETTAHRGKLNDAAALFQKLMDANSKLSALLIKLNEAKFNVQPQKKQVNIFPNRTCDYLTNTPQWIECSIDSYSIYFIEGKIGYEDAPALKNALIQFEFFGTDKKIISPPYEGLSTSENVGEYCYVPIYDKDLSKFLIHFRTPHQAALARLGFRGWNNKKPVVLESQANIYSYKTPDFIEDNDVVSSWTYFKLAELLQKQNKLSEAWFFFNKSLLINQNFYKCQDRLKELEFQLRHGNSINYWEERYALGGNSGIGTYNQKLAEFKASVLNDLVEKENMNSVIEFGCGDGHQLRFAKYPSYIGLDVSKAAVSKCQKLFENDSTKSFFLYDSLHFDDKKSLFIADMSISIDVIYHLVEDRIYYAYLKHLFNSSRKLVAIYSWNFENRDKFKMYIRPRVFTKDVEKKFPEWHLWKTIPNLYPAIKYGENEGSFSDFYIYRKLTKS